MPSISSCPDCHRDLTVPDSETADEVLRCPLCGSEFPAERILADSVRFPPLAIVVKSANSQAGGDKSSPATAAIGPAEAPLADMPAESAHAAMPGLANKPATAAEPNHELPSEQPFGEPPEPEHFDAVVEEPEPGDQGMGIDLSRLTVSRSAGAMSAVASGGADATDADGAGGGKSGEAAAGFEAPAMRVSTQPRPRGGGFTALVAQFVGVVVGGAMGLAIGYYILLWFAGAQADVLDMRSKLPSWLLPPIREQRSANSNPDSAEQTLAGQPSTETYDIEPSLAQIHDRRAARPDDDAPLTANPPSFALEPSDGDDRSIVRAQFNEPLNAPSDERTSAYLAAERPGGIPSADQTMPGDGPAPMMLGPRDPTTHSFDDLEAALERATSALCCGHCGFDRGAPLSETVGDDDDDDDDDDGATSEAASAGRRPARCEFCRGSGVGNLTTAVFEQLCQLAESLTFANIDGHEDDAEALRDEAEDLLRAIGESRSKSEIVGRLAAGRLDDRRRSSNGAVLAGTVSEVGWQGELFTVRLVLAGVARPVTVIGRDAPRPELEPRDRVLIFGSIIDSPCDTLAGYLGDSPQVIWGGLAVKILTRE